MYYGQVKHMAAKMINFLRLKPMEYNIDYRGEVACFSAIFFEEIRQSEEPEFMIELLDSFGEYSSAGHPDDDLT